MRKKPTGVASSRVASLPGVVIDFDVLLDG